MKKPKTVLYTRKSASESAVGKTFIQTAKTTGYLAILPRKTELEKILMAFIEGPERRPEQAEQDTEALGGKSNVIKKAALPQTCLQCQCSPGKIRHPSLS